jgi:hypothetical protein
LELIDGIEILAVGSKSTAASRMMKAGANKGATGENAIIRTCGKADVILGTLAIIISNSRLGEVTIGMTGAVCFSNANKILIPLSPENVQRIGVNQEPLLHLTAKAI